ncbi:hypothetical protein BCR36DRAFT_357221 [Piromyces finnis]|uniref:Lebercilin domain-containing protein n=1 Tax=Piromyces finnis TaxID=1754191 RepID=A0A1Y1V369_9FUNG|nr:hypothetical protein BCR36DRAFT_357221 [Piromyces finnis]|eukprot:ORX46149.1 hypothetical protein BCR36DRAFT_357221 [Piromyces finnis]
MILDNLSNKISPFIRKGKRFNVTVVRYTNLSNDNKTVQAYPFQQFNNTNIKNGQNIHNSLSTQNNSYNNNDYTFNSSLNQDNINENENVFNLSSNQSKEYNKNVKYESKILEERRRRSLSSIDITNKNKKNINIRKRAKSNVLSQININRDSIPNYKIYDKIENYDDVTSKVYLINNKGEVPTTKNTGISETALIAIKYKMNKQLEKEKENVAKLTEDNSVLQKRIKSLEKKLMETVRNNAANAYSLSLPQINELKQKNKKLKENIERQEIMMKMFKRRTLKESKENARTIKDLEKLQELSTRKIDNLVSEIDSLKKDKNHMENIIERYKSKFSSKNRLKTSLNNYSREKSFHKDSETEIQLPPIDNAESNTIFKTQSSNKLSKIPKFTKNSTDILINKSISTVKEKKSNGNLTSFNSNLPLIKNKSNVQNDRKIKDRSIYENKRKKNKVNQNDMKNKEFNLYEKPESSKGKVDELKNSFESIKEDNSIKNINGEARNTIMNNTINNGIKKNLKYNSLEKLKSNFTKNIEKNKKKALSSSEANKEKILAKSLERLDKDMKKLENIKNVDNKPIKPLGNKINDSNYNIEVVKSQIEYQVYIKGKK